MFLQYLLFFLLIYAFGRFIGGLIDLGRRADAGRMDGPRKTPRPHLKGRDVEDADFEILPPDDEDPPARS